MQEVLFGMLEKEYLNTDKARCCSRQAWQGCVCMTRAVNLEYVHTWVASSASRCAYLFSIYKYVLYTHAETKNE